MGRVPIKIWEPRYRDKTVLVAKNKIENGADVPIEITKGFYKGLYLAKLDVVKGSPVEKMKCKAGGEIEVVAVPLSGLEKMGD